MDTTMLNDVAKSQDFISKSLINNTNVWNNCAAHGKLTAIQLSNPHCESQPTCQSCPDCGWAPAAVACSVSTEISTTRSPRSIGSVISKPRFVQTCINENWLIKKGWKKGRYFLNSNTKIYFYYFQKFRIAQISSEYLLHLTNKKQLYQH